MLTSGPKDTSANAQSNGHFFSHCKMIFERNWITHRKAFRVCLFPVAKGQTRCLSFYFSHAYPPPAPPPPMYLSFSPCSSYSPRLVLLLLLLIFLIFVFHLPLLYSSSCPWLFSSFSSCWIFTLNEVCSYFYIHFVDSTPIAPLFPALVNILLLVVVPKPDSYSDLFPASSLIGATLVQCINTQEKDKDLRDLVPHTLCLNDNDIQRPEYIQQQLGPHAFTICCL